MFRAKQLYEPDTVSICGEDNKEEMLLNQIKPRAGGDKLGVNLTLDVKQCDVIAGGLFRNETPFEGSLKQHPV